MRLEALRRGSEAMVVGAALAAVLAGCGGGGAPAATPDGGDAGAGAGSMAALTFCTAYRAQQAALSARCNGGAKADWAAVADSYKTCDEFASWADDHRLTFHPELAQACLDAYGPQRDCSSQDATTCFAEVLAGKAAYGEACHSDYDCPPEGVCWTAGEFAFNACVPTVCTKPPTVGDSCDTVCLGGACVGGKCVANSKAGGPCANMDDPFCDVGLTCDVSANKCVARGAAGASCHLDVDCLSILACVGGTCAERLPVGAPCDFTETACTGFAYCDPATGTCVAAGRLNQPCAGNEGFYYFCIDGTCQTKADGIPRCYAEGALGGSCLLGYECASGGCLNGACAACGG